MAGKIKSQKKEIINVDLWISKDGHSLVDKNNNIIARFVEDTTVLTNKKNLKLPGHMECWYECYAWNGDKCVKWVRTCQWVFDPI